MRGWRWVEREVDGGKGRVREDVRKSEVESVEHEATQSSD